MFRSDVQKVKSSMKTGDQVLVRGEMNVFPPKGNYQLIVRELSLVGLGEQLVKLELLKKKLESLGYFAAARKQPLPRFPKRIAVVTSPTGAVIRDIIHVLSRRLIGFHIIINPVRVQGEGAELEVAQALYQLNQHNLADVIIVARGGGSFEDLAPFNTEIVAKAIVESRIPVVSAIGHETDFSISDFVADVRAPTPSAAAEIVSEEVQNLLENLSKHHKLTHKALMQLLFTKKQQIRHVLKQPLFLAPTFLLGSFIQRLDWQREALNDSITSKYDRAKTALLQAKKRLQMAAPWVSLRENANRLLRLEKGLQSAYERIAFQKKERLALLEKKIPPLIQRTVQIKKKELEQMTSHLASLNPKSILKKGYSILFSQKNGSVITSIKSVEAEEPVRIVLHDGEIETNIKRVHVYERTEK